MAFTNVDGSEDISTLPSYVTAHVYLYLCVLLGIALLGVLNNVLPVTRRFLSRTLATAEAGNSCQTTVEEGGPACRGGFQLQSFRRICRLCQLSLDI
jgi:hypothetical protein